MRIFLTIVAVIFSIHTVDAATVHLNDGNSVQGEIIKQDAKSIDISVDGVSMTYYADEIKDIDGHPLGAAAQAAAAPAPVPPPAPAPAPAQPSVGQAPSTPATTAGIDPEKKALILKFIDVFGTRKALNDNFEVMIQQIEKDKPEEAQKIRQRVKVDEIIDRLLPIYDRNFSAGDLKAFIAFYSSDEGKKLISTIPELMKESVQESIKYMEEKFPEAQGATKS